VKPSGAPPSPGLSETICIQRGEARPFQLCLRFEALELYMGLVGEGPRPSSTGTRGIDFQESTLLSDVPSDQWSSSFLNHSPPFLVFGSGQSAVQKCLLQLIPRKSSCTSRGVWEDKLPISRKYPLSFFLYRSCRIPHLIKPNWCVFML